MNTALQHSKEIIKTFFLDGIISVKPEKVLSTLLKVDKEYVFIGEKKFRLDHGKCYIIGFGKAVMSMSFNAEAILADKFNKGVLSVPQGLVAEDAEFHKFKIYPGGFNNIPDINSLKATDEIIKIAKEAKETDLVLVMISGGGSALLAKPTLGFDLNDKINLISRLTKFGADIKELNCVRKRLSDVKGGKLLKYIFPAPSVSFILSDIVGDPLDLISSGPTVKNSESSEKALGVLKKYNLLQDFPYLEDIIKKEEELDHKYFIKADNIIVANNKVALDQMKETALKNNYATAILSSDIESDVELLSKLYAQLAYSFAKPAVSMDKSTDLALKQLGLSDSKILELKATLKNSKKICFLMGGETVVKVKGSGVGGRNQELALRFSVELEKLVSKGELNENSLIFLSGGTDGIDGPTDAAGAVTYPGQTARAMLKGLDPKQYIEDNNSYNYFKHLDKSDLLLIGHTGVNVMDIHILLIHR